MSIARYSMIAAAVLAITACGKQEPAKKAETKPASAPASAPAAAGDTIKIGYAGPLTGNIAHIGKDLEYGARLAVDTFNEAGGVELAGKKMKLVLVAEDDQGDPKTATTVAQRFVDQKVVGVVGHLQSGTSIPASKIYSDAGIPQITPSSTAIAYTAQGYKTTFRLIANDAQQGKVLAEYAVKTLKAKKVAIIDDRTAYGQGLADEFEKAAKAAGATVVKREFTNDKETDFNSILTSIKGTQPDLIFYGGLDAQGAPLKKQAKKLGIKATLMGADAWQTPEFIKLAGADAEGAYASIPGQPKERMPGSKEFLAKFKQKFNTEVQLYAPNSYDAVLVMVEAMKKAGSSEPAKYLPELAKVSYSGGVTGPISFDAKGDIKDGAITIYQVKNGKWEIMEVVGGAAKK
ncbi:branched-chain amino acid transport system substrate-binding protein [Formivibrio citricus]|uniref:Branched-chain amino acid transport system substrate-binding protein n=1 Tax=Formivibrio citricus TaxID=83765 RepID=A0A1I5B6Y0_9NEIS|nr:branched-chain amino acid ABC transporter substrate-binding protein [Formivibrio citricus]SFN70467.1 branched-chain amino acid transport system substrate-binding protein [Formivibrio citricus]